jgi:beta-aspartyl-peptidase (threonine type)
MSTASPPHWSLAIHGGAGGMSRGNLTPEADAAARAALSAALDAGAAVLAAGGAALDAVEAAVQSLEDAPEFNAGRGAVFTADGTVELDAAIMDGTTRSAGAVARVTRTRSPVALARAVMEQTPHVMLAGIGADAFALTTGLEQVDPAWFRTPERARQFAEAGTTFDRAMKYGTVGAVARDVHGHVAAATSTGGVTGKRWGRIGDSPLIGAGTYADDRAAAVSATGSGEDFIRLGVAHEICARVRLLGESVADAARTLIAEVGAVGGAGGVIAMSPGGEATWTCNTSGMYRGSVASTTAPRVAIYADEEPVVGP